MKEFVSKIIKEIIGSCMLEESKHIGTIEKEAKKVIISNYKDQAIATLNINKKKYDFKKIEIENEITTSEGVYFFVAKKDFEFTVKEIFSPFASLRIGTNGIEFFYACTPKINFYKNEKTEISSSIYINKGELIYVGQAQDIKSRYHQHFSDKIDKTSSLKLELRDSIKKNVNFYYVEIKEKEERSELEKKIHSEYFSRFGE